MFKGVDVDKDNKDLRTSKSYCSANVTFRTSHFIYMSMSYELLQCKVTDGDKVQMFTFSPLSSGEKPGEMMMMFEITSS